MTIWFDMDGTIADLYGVDGWLEDIINQNPRPYIEAKPLLNLSLLARRLNKLQKKGYKIGIISWLSKKDDIDYSIVVTKAKKKWLKKHLPSVKWDNVNIVKYGMNKWEVCGNGILFDDEEQNRSNWKNDSYEPKEILRILKKLLDEN